MMMKKSNYCYQTSAISRCAHKIKNTFLCVGKMKVQLKEPIKRPQKKQGSGIVRWLYQYGWCGQNSDIVVKGGVGAVLSIDVSNLSSPDCQFFLKPMVTPVLYFVEMAT